MQIDDADTALLKKWIVKRLEDISDADSDVLADYVLALVKSEDPDEQVKANCLENLGDFLHDHTTPFVDDVLNAVRTKSYLPGNAAAPPTQPASSSLTPSFNPPSGPANGNRRPSAQFQNGFYSSGGDQARKRTWGDRAGSEQRDGQDSHYGRGVGGERAIKQMRRGNHQGGGRGGRQGGDMSIAGLSGLGQGSMPPMPNMPSMPSHPPGFPPLDPNNPLQAMLAMQALGFPGLPGMPQPSMAGSSNNFGQSAPNQGFQQAGSPPPRRMGQRCRDYDTKGYCALGSVCPYEHGTDPIIVPEPGATKFRSLYPPPAFNPNTVPKSGAGISDILDRLSRYTANPNNIPVTNPRVPEYDPKSATIDTERPTNGHGHSQGPERRHNDRGRGGRGRGRGEGGRRGGRAAFSSAGPNHDRSIKTIVVEQIPEEKFSDEAVREFFSEFGDIEEVTMQAYKRLALIKYADYWAARRAYDSPKVIFDNRFVKVYWYKPDQMSADANGTNGRQGSEGAGARKDDEEMIDMEEVTRKQAEAQKAHEEKQKKLKEAEVQKAELAEKLKVQAEERKKLLERLAEKTAKKTSSPTSPKITGGDGSPANGDAGPPNSNVDEQKSGQTEALRLKLAQLEAEAESMGLNPNESYSAGSTYRGRGGRGTFRGRGSWAPRGRGGYEGSHRGAYRGRGSFAGAPYGGARGGAVKRLDNRPKRVLVKINEGEEEWTAERDETLRSYLFNNFEFESVDPFPDAKNALIVAFKERYVAENFLSSPSDIPASIGKVQLSWAPNPPQQAQPLPGATGGGEPPSVAGSTSSMMLNDADVAMGDGSVVGSGGAGAGASMEGADGKGEEFDVAEDDDRWMAQ